MEAIILHTLYVDPSPASKSSTIKANKPSVFLLRCVCRKQRSPSAQSLGEDRDAQRSSSSAPYLPSSILCCRQSESCRAAGVPSLLQPSLRLRHYQARATVSGPNQVRARPRGRDQCLCSQHHPGAAGRSRYCGCSISTRYPKCCAT